jgi:1-acyl-sn-glycerol-3-phosphate acyltransferase
VVVVIPVTFLLFLTPGIMRRRKLVRLAARIVSKLTGSTIGQSGWEIPQDLPCIVVANHSSYLDGIILTAVLPARFAFLIKQEMANIPLIGFVLKQIGSEFVDRQNPQDRHRMAKRLVESARRGWTLALFPEGTFDTQPGLQRFHTGAFTAALRGSLPLVPVVIQGAREKMPGTRIMPFPGKITVHVCEPIFPAGATDTLEALIAATRRSMLSHLDEPDRDPQSTTLAERSARAALEGTATDPSPAGSTSHKPAGQ